MVRQYLNALPDRPGVIVSHQGGIVHKINKWRQLQRFLVLGAVDTYYAGADEHFEQGKNVILECLDDDPGNAIGMMLNIVREKRAAKLDAPLFAYSLALAHKNRSVRKLAYQNLDAMAPFSTPLFHLYAMVKKQRPISGEGIRKAFARWYQKRTPEELAYQAAKYQQRDGVGHSNILRSCHPKDPNQVYVWAPDEHGKIGGGKAVPIPDPRHAVYEYMMGRELPKEAPALLKAVETVHELMTGDGADNIPALAEALQLVIDHKLTREMLPTNMLNSPATWFALLQDMPIEAMIRNLGKMGSLGLLSKGSVGASMVREKLENAEQIFRSGIHPLKLYQAQRIYEQGHGTKGNLTWTPNPDIVDSLDDAFYMSFGNIETTGKCVVLALDLSGSMWGTLVAGMEDVRASTAAAIMAMATVRSEPNCKIMGFDTRPIELPISSRMRLVDVERMMQARGGGGTDLRIPYSFLTAMKEQADAIVVYTDDAGGFGNANTSLEQYRRTVNPDVLAATVGFATYPYSHIKLGDDHPNNLMMVGLDTATPMILSAFIKGEL